MFRRLKRQQPTEDDRFAMLDLITEFVECDSQDCDVNPVGDCVPHGYPTMEAGLPCPYTRARVILEAYRPLLEARQRQRAAEAKAALFALAYSRPEHIDHGTARESRRERARWEIERDAARRYGGQHSPRGVVRPPLVTTQQVTPPPATYVPEDR